LTKHAGEPCAAHPPQQSRLVSTPAVYPTEVRPPNSECATPDRLLRTKLLVLFRGLVKSVLQFLRCIEHRPHTVRAQSWHRRQQLDHAPDKANEGRQKGPQGPWAKAHLITRIALKSPPPRQSRGVPLEQGVPPGRRSVGHPPPPPAPTIETQSSPGGGRVSGSRVGHQAHP
jgi:hypothetical protein